MATAELPRVEATSESPAEPEGLYEVVDGKIVEKAMGFLEGRIAFRLGYLLESFAEAHQLGWTFVEEMFRTRRDRDQARRPDVAFLTRERWPLDRPFPEVLALDVPPDLAIEVVSPSDRAGDLEEKIEEYFAVGVRQVWVIYRKPGKVVIHESPTTARTLRRGEILDGGVIVPGFRLPVSDLLPGPAPGEGVGLASPHDPA